MSVSPLAGLYPPDLRAAQRGPCQLRQCYDARRQPLTPRGLLPQASARPPLRGIVKVIPPLEAQFVDSGLAGSSPSANVLLSRASSALNRANQALSRASSCELPQRGRVLSPAPPPPLRVLSPEPPPPLPAHLVLDTSAIQEVTRLQLSPVEARLAVNEALMANLQEKLSQQRHEEASSLQAWQEEVMERIRRERGTRAARAPATQELHDIMESIESIRCSVAGVSAQCAEQISALVDNIDTLSVRCQQSFRNVEKRMSEMQSPTPIYSEQVVLEERSQMHRLQSIEDRFVEVDGNITAVSSRCELQLKEQQSSAVANEPPLDPSDRIMELESHVEKVDRAVRVGMVELSNRVNVLEGKPPLDAPTSSSTVIGQYFEGWLG